MRAILTYHSIDRTDSPISVSPERFRAHCAFIASGRVASLPLDALVADPHGHDAVSITFDDGFANTLEVAWPIMEEFGLTATVFVVPGHVGGFNNWGGHAVTGIPRLPLMDWEALGALQGRGAVIGAHGQSHASLPTLAPAAIADELDRCVGELRDHLGVTTRHFAYPYGHVDTSSAAAVRPRFAVGVTTELRPIARGDDRALVPRLDMYYFRRRGALEGWGSASFRSHVWIRRLGRRARALIGSSRVPVARVG